MVRFLRRHPILAFGTLLFVPCGALTLWLSARLGGSPVVVWFAVLNLAVLPLWAWDKSQARRERFRVPELALHLAAFAGAVPGSWLAMRVLRHKTQKPHFRWLFALFGLLQIALLALWLLPGLRPSWLGG